MAVPNVGGFCQNRIIEPVVRRYKAGRYVPLASELRAIKLVVAGSRIFGLGTFLKAHDEIVGRKGISVDQLPLRRMAWDKVVALEGILQKNGYNKSSAQIWCPQTTMNFGKSVIAHAALRALPLPLTLLTLNEMRKRMMINSVSSAEPK